MLIGLLYYCAAILSNYSVFKISELRGNGVKSLRPVMLESWQNRNMLKSLSFGISQKRGTQIRGLSWQHEGIFDPSPSANLVSFRRGFKLLF